MGPKAPGSAGKHFPVLEGFCRSRREHGCTALLRHGSSDWKNRYTTAAGYSEGPHLKDRSVRPSPEAWSLSVVHRRIFRSEQFRASATQLDNARRQQWEKLDEKSAHLARPDKYRASLAHRRHRHRHLRRKPSQPKALSEVSN